ncbi:hypothetical protein [Amycolatopsis aidingensis]|uniref:hypothetical protein n=1 Tax=Amycolatopsis aidingensis TaxID=2842453 RepID=UPI001C0AA3F5|nr:hypothetical protein [Amycolatopsis aidingensis]
MDHDVHGICNLAPICGACNKAKSGMDLSATGLLLSMLHKARKLAPEITRQVVAFGSPSKLESALLEATEADLSDTRTREIFERSAPAVVQRLAELGDGKADYFVFKEVRVEASESPLYTCGPPVMVRVGLKLYECGRASMTVLERVVGGRLEVALRVPLSDLLELIATTVGSAFERYSENPDASKAGEVNIEWPEITIDRVEFDSRSPIDLEFEFAGEFRVAATAGVAWVSQRDGSLEDVQGDATVSGRFRFELSWAPGVAIGKFHFGQVWLEDWQADVWITPGRESLRCQLSGSH